MSRAVLVTGGSGQVGGAVASLAQQRGLAVWAPSRSELDLCGADSIAAAVRSRALRGIINCAAYTAVDAAEREPDLAYAINAAAPAVLARCAAELEIPLVHVSTDYVFDGSKSDPYVEDDPVRPLGVYGGSKEAGEAAVRALAPRHAIVRTAWVVSAGGRNFLDTMLRLAAERDEVRVVSDQRGSPTSASDLGAALLAVLDGLGERSGTWHFANAGEATWHELADHIFYDLGRRGRPVPRLVAIPTSAYPTPAARPANSRLATGRFTRDFGIEPQPWQAAINTILAERLGA